MPRRAGQPPLTREAIVAAALRVIDEAGLDALSMRRLGRELAVDPMAVYHHIPTKEDVLRAVVREVFGGLRVEPAGRSWREQVVAWAQSYRAMALAHPNLVLRILADLESVAIAATEANESLYAALDQAGLDPLDAVRGADTIVDFIHGVVLAEAAAGGSGEHGAGTSSPAATNVFDEALDSLSPEQVPVQLRLREATRGQRRDSFTFGLDLILTGLTTHTK
jgi:TetR/AcrR family transcriptional regulator, tetracycline repressor protein